MTYGLEGYTTDPRILAIEIGRHGFPVAAAAPAPEEEDPDGPARRVPLPPTLPAARDWAELPVDAILQVFRWLDHVDILMGAGLACRSWRAAARDEPALWRRIDMRGFACLPYWQSHRRDTVRAMAREAVRRSDGRCEEFWSKVGGDDEVLRFLADQ